MSLIFPIQNQDVWELYKKSIQCFWHAEEIDFSNDVITLKTLSKEKKELLAYILLFFKNTDLIVIQNIHKNFINEFKELEIIFCYNYQLFVESIHQEVYHQTLFQYQSNEEFNDICNKIEKDLNEKNEWTLYALNFNNLSLCERIVYFIAVEGILFSSNFAMIFWFKHINERLDGLIESNELISRDESLHTLFGIMLYNNYLEKCSKNRVYEIFDQAVNIECRLIDKYLENKTFNIFTKDNFKNYVKYITDYILKQMNLETKYNVENPFNFINSYTLLIKSNFFEKRNTVYIRNHNMLKESDLSIFD